MNVNKVILIGRLGKDPVISHPQADVTRAEFTLATSESYKKDEQWIETTEWHNILAWRYQGVYVERNLRKGMLVYVEGKIRSRQYTDKNGIQRTFYEIVADNIQKLERTDRAQMEQPQANYGNNLNQPVQQQPVNSELPDTPFTNMDSPDDDLPF
ncbi:MAG: single-stranded DNA-binding protein [Bacteroidales bacterium]|nr:single-stranded DNA-binding protein [Bacteroidales bacterium]